MMFIPRTCPTITVVSPDTGRPININQSDFNADPEKWKEWEDDMEEPEVEAKTETASTEESEDKVPPLKRRVKKKK